MSDTRFTDDIFRLNKFETNNKVAIAPGNVVKFFNPEPASSYASVASAAYTEKYDCQWWCFFGEQSGSAQLAGLPSMEGDLPLEELGKRTPAWEEKTFLNVTPGWHNGKELTEFRSLSPKVPITDTSIYVFVFPMQKNTYGTPWQHEGRWRNMGPTYLPAFEGPNVNYKKTPFPSPRKDFTCMIKNKDTTKDVIITWSMLLPFYLAVSSPGGGGGMGPDECKVEIEKALDVWVSILHSAFSPLNVSFVYLENSPTADIRFYTDVATMDYSAVTSLWQCPDWFGSGVVLYSKIGLNCLYRWRKDDCNDLFCLSLRYTAFHELGHIFSMDHSTDYSSLMTPSVQNICLNSEPKPYFFDFINNFGTTRDVGYLQAIYADAQCCTCEDIASISEAQLVAIERRQKAAGIVLEWDSEDPKSAARLIDTTGSACYTLADLKSYVNYIAPNFIQGTYSGGASLPTMLTNVYANPAADVTELNALVLLMLETKRSSDLIPRDAFHEANVLGLSRISDELAKADAYANYGISYLGEQRLVSVTLHSFDSVRYNANMKKRSRNFEVTSLSTDVAHSVKFFGYFFNVQTSPEVGVFDAQGDGVEENKFCLMATSVSSSNATVESGYVFDILTPPPNWGHFDPPITYFGYYCSLEFAVVTWSF